ARRRQPGVGRRRGEPARPPRSLTPDEGVVRRVGNPRLGGSRPSGRRVSVPPRPRHRWLVRTRRGPSAIARCAVVAAAALLGAAVPAGARAGSFEQLAGLADQVQAATWSQAAGADRSATATGAPRLDTRREWREAPRNARRRAWVALAVNPVRPSLRTASSRAAFLRGRCFGRRVTRAPAPRRARRCPLVVRLGGRDPTRPAASTDEAAPDRPPHLATRLSALGRLIRRPERPRVG